MVRPNEVPSSFLCFPLSNVTIIGALTNTELHAANTRPGVIGRKACWIVVVNKIQQKNTPARRDARDDVSPKT